MADMARFQPLYRSATGFSGPCISEAARLCFPIDTWPSERHLDRYQHEVEDTYIKGTGSRQAFGY
jgi:hypothetical protein